MYVRRESREKLNDESVIPTVKHISGFVIVLGFFAAESAGHLI